MRNRYAGFFAAYNASVSAGNPNTKEETIREFTNGRTKSLKDLNNDELDALVLNLNSLSRFAPKKPVPDDKADKMRKSIIAIFKQMGKTTQDAINWAEKQGVKGAKKKFNDYTTGELFTLIRIAEKVRAEWQLTIRNKMKTL